MTVNLDTHHLILYGVATALALLGVYLVEARVADKAQSKADAADARATLIQQQNQTFQQAVSVQLAQLQAANLSLTQALATQQKKDVVLTPTELGNRLATLVTVKPEEVKPTTNGFELSSNAMLQSVMSLEQVPVLTQQLANTEKELSLEKQAHQSDNTSNVAAISACKSELTMVKAKARKSKFKWFIAGVVTGFVGRSVLK